jgi:hypothetical protein
MADAVAGTLVVVCGLGLGAFLACKIAEVGGVYWFLSPIVVTCITGAAAAIVVSVKRWARWHRRSARM